MIHVFIGTKAQLIKMAPIMVELQDRGIPYNFIFSGQHKATVSNIRREFGIKDPDVTLYRGKDITSVMQMLIWGLRIVFKAIKNRKTIWQGDSRGIVLNHGDTFTTLLGSVLAKLCGHRSAHVESGLRSFKLFHPFPEEAIRVLTFRLSDIYYAPGEWATSNLEKCKGLKINTKHNTLLDSLRISDNNVKEAIVEIPNYEFALVSIHRFENIFSRKQLKKIVELIVIASQKMPLLFILHKPTEQKLAQFGLMSTLESAPNIELRPRYSYFQFVKLTRKATFVITDGGSNQEECHYMGKPCLIMRAATERREGLGENAVICNYDRDILDSFLDRTFTAGPTVQSNNCSPTKIIVDSLIELDGGQNASLT